MLNSVTIHLGKVPASKNTVASTTIKVIDNHLVIRTDYSARELGFVKDAIRASLMEVSRLESMYDRAEKRKTKG